MLLARQWVQPAWEGELAFCPRRDIFSQGFGPFRWVCTSGDPQDLAVTDQLATSVLEEAIAGGGKAGDAGGWVAPQVPHSKPACLAVQGSPSPNPLSSFPAWPLWAEGHRLPVCAYWSVPLILCSHLWAPLSLWPPTATRPTLLTSSQSVPWSCGFSATELWFGLFTWSGEVVSPQSLLVLIEGMNVSDSGLHTSVH